jgi:hypothetical protein
VLYLRVPGKRVGLPGRSKGSDMETVLLFIVIGNTLALLGSGTVTLTSLRKISDALVKISEAVNRVEETAARGERMTARVLTMLAGIEEHDQ